MRCDPLLLSLYKFLPPSAYSGPARRIPPGIRLVIDIGGGAGGLAKKLAKDGRLHEYVLVDPDPCLVSIAPNTAWSHRVLGVAEHLPLRETRQSIAVLHDALHHTRDPRLVIREAARAAECILVSEVTPRSIAGGIIELVEKALGYPANFLEPGEAAELLEENGVKPFIERGSRGSYFVSGCKARKGLGLETPPHSPS